MIVPTLFYLCCRYFSLNHPNCIDYCHIIKCNYESPSCPCKFLTCKSCNITKIVNLNFNQIYCEKCRPLYYVRIFKRLHSDLNEYIDEINEFGFCTLMCYLCDRFFTTSSKFLSSCRLCLDCLDNETVYVEIRQHYIAWYNRHINLG